MKINLWLLPLLLSACCFLLADDEHGDHEEITEAQVGTVHFPSSCAPAVKKPIERGVAMLHSFWYEAAEKQFVQIETRDPQCAIARWGVAMSLWHQLWNRPDRATLGHGLMELERARALHASEREREYIAALRNFYAHPGKPYQKRATAYSKAMEKVSERNPDDHEAAAFYALSLLASERDDDKKDSNRKKAAAVLEKLFAEEPNHPGVAHYLIHTYDTPTMAEHGLSAAHQYAQLAPAAPHALHMPAHIFARLGLWQDDINSNLASIAATQKEAAMHMAGEGHQFHAMDFLVYAYLQTGRETDAQKIIDEVRAMPPMHDMYGMGFDPRLFALSAFPASYVLELHRWDEAARLPLIDGASDANQSTTYTARAIGAARRGNFNAARQEIGRLEAMQQKLKAQKKTDEGDYEYVSEEVTLSKAWLTDAEGHPDEGIRSLRGLADKEEGEAEASQGIPIRELIADMLFDAKRPREALAEYEASLKTDPGRFDSLYGAAQSAEQVGDHEKATEYYAALVKNCEASTSERAELKHAREVIEAGTKRSPRARLESAPARVGSGE